MRSFFTVLAVFLFASCAHLNQRPTSSISLETFFKIENSQVVLSPDGQRVAYLKFSEGRPAVVLRSLEDMSEDRLTEEDPGKIETLVWKNNDLLLYTEEVDASTHHIFSFDLKTRERKNLIDRRDVRFYILDVLNNSDHEILITSNQNNPEIYDVYRLDLRNGRLTMVARNPGPFTRWLVDHQGRVRGAVASDGVNSTFFHRTSDGANFQPVVKTNFKDSFTPLFYHFDGQRLFALSNIGRDRLAVVEYDPRSRREIRVVAEHPEVDMASLTFSPRQKTLLSAGYYVAKKEWIHLNKDHGEMMNAIAGQLQGLELEVASHDKNENRFIIRVQSDKTPGAYYLYDRANQNLKLLLDVNPNLPVDQMATTEPIQFTARDGLKISGYLIIPPGRTAKSLPVIVRPHDDPWERAYWHFDPETQFLANQGFAILKINARGSKGYGRKFWMASFKQWGQGVLNDLNDGVQWLIGQGIIDRSRVCIYGGRHGGYQALAALSFSPDVYQCGVDYVGTSNLFTFLESVPPYWEAYRQMLYETIGHPIKDKELLTKISPIYHLGNIKSPLMIAHGATDPRVKQQESEQIVQSLKKRGIDVVYMLKTDEGHGFKNEENKKDFYRTMANFLKKHL